LVILVTFFRKTNHGFFRRKEIFFPPWFQKSLPWLFSPPFFLSTCDHVGPPPFSPRKGTSGFLCHRPSFPLPLFSSIRPPGKDLLFLECNIFSRAMLSCPLFFFFPEALVTAGRGTFLVFPDFFWGPKGSALYRSDHRCCFLSLFSH